MRAHGGLWLKFPEQLCIITIYIIYMHIIYIVCVYMVLYIYMHGYKDIVYIALSIYLSSNLAISFISHSYIHVSSGGIMRDGKIGKTLGGTMRRPYWNQLCVSGKHLLTSLYFYGGQDLWLGGLVGESFPSTLPKVVQRGFKHFFSIQKNVFADVWRSTWCTINCRYLQCTVWWILIYLYIHESITIIKRLNIIITNTSPSRVFNNVNGRFYWWGQKEGHRFSLRTGCQSPKSEKVHCSRYQWSLNWAAQRRIRRCQWKFFNVLFLAHRHKRSKEVEDENEGKRAHSVSIHNTECFRWSLALHVDNRQHILLVMKEGKIFLSTPPQTTRLLVYGVGEKL